MIPDHLNILKVGHTKELNEFHKLKRGIFMDTLHIVGNQMIQNLHNLRTKEVQVVEY